MTQIAIVGSGPSGCYIADMLAKKVDNSQVDIFDRLPTPFGLVRAGVAPDHQGTKNITRQFERTLARDNVRFLGNIEIGSDLSYSDLKTHYDVVVLTIGAMQDRKLGIAGEDLTGVYGSGEFVAWYNGHPDYCDLQPSLNGPSVAIIGNGNVALDISRVLAKSAEEMSQSDIVSSCQQQIQQAQITDIYVIGRRGPLDASFTNPELSEFAELERCVPLIDNEHLPEVLPEDVDPKQARTLEKNLNTLQQYAQNNAEQKPVRLHFKFCASPIEVIGNDGQAQTIKLEKTELVDGRSQGTGELFELPAQTVISAIGYHSEALEDVPFDAHRGIVQNNDGVVEPGVYTAGWCKRGPQGVIPANRADAMAVAKQIISDLETTAISKQAQGFSALEAKLNGKRVVSADDWQKINQIEIDQAVNGKPREKINRISEMLSLLD